MQPPKPDDMNAIEVFLLRYGIDIGFLVSGFFGALLLVSKNSAQKLSATIASILDKKIYYSLDGIDLTKNYSPKNGLNFILAGYFKSENNFKNQLIYKSASMWDSNGGYIFHYFDRKKAILLFLYRLIIHHPEFAFLIENIKKNSQNKLKDFKTALKHLTYPSIKYGTPCFSKKEAKKAILKKFIESEIFNEKIKIRMAIKKLKNDKKI